MRAVGRMAAQLAAKKTIRRLDHLNDHGAEDYSKAVPRSPPPHEEAG
jgi:hypothetical protein